MDNEKFNLSQKWPHYKIDIWTKKMELWGQAHTYLYLEKMQGLRQWYGQDHKGTSLEWAMV